ncbi:MAG: hypothetical protein D3914_01615, partial [Candidatus Electrothrix sp. LOE2]|nr:hypothetical protein [Candidatus Electrothrix sp. LOE2]
MLSGHIDQQNNAPVNLSETHCLVSRELTGKFIRNLLLSFVKSHWEVSCKLTGDFPRPDRNSCFLPS